MQRSLVLLLLLCGSLFAADPVKPLSVAPDVPATWKAGAASVVITPEKFLWMAGYSARKKPAEGKAQDLFAKALALEDEAGTRVVIVTMDLIGVPQPLRRAVAERAQKEYHLPSECLLLNASHTHSGPSLHTGPVTDKDLENPRTRDAFEYTNALQDKLVGVIGAALAQLAPARLTWSHARCGFAMNRRLLTPRGYANSPNPEGPVDHEVPALRVESPEGVLRAALFGTPATIPASASTNTAATTPGTRRSICKRTGPALSRSSSWAALAIKILTRAATTSCRASPPCNSPSNTAARLRMPSSWRSPPARAPSAVRSARRTRK